MLHSQQVRALAPENDPLRIGMGWSREDLEKPQILVESTFGTVTREVLIWMFWCRKPFAGSRMRAVKGPGTL